ncbi:MAG: hypothetical protein KAY22_10320 [Rhizorhabdus sp.]|uniref:hypothetical protein n=1 Tax=Rhizorhabdus sp. TaxID=1968843 RepID=UPI001B77E1BA|nr:hypothetical protein [Rhizorhabdus sp.]MBP8232690.1 hypothetical protein [Rhizorhabdus sp.]
MSKLSEWFDRKRARQATHLEKIPRGERLSLIVAAVAAFATIGSVVVGFIQWQSMQRSILVSRQIADQQLKFAQKVVEDSNQDTREALNYTAKLVRSAQLAQADTSKLATEATESNRQAAASNRTAAGALATAQANSQNQLRAYVDIELAQALPLFKKGDEGKYFSDVEISNTGASPAIDLTISGNALIENTRDKVIEELKKNLFYKSASSSIISKKLNLRNYWNHITEDDVSSQENGSKLVVIILKVDYTDIYGVEHMTMKCLMFFNKNSAELCPSEYQVLD